MALAAIPAIISIATAAGSAVAQANAGDVANRQAEQEAILAGYRRRDEARRATLAAGAQRALGRQYQAAGVAAAGAGGVSSTSGSTADLIAASVVRAEQNAQTIGSNARRADWAMGAEQEQILAGGRRARRSSMLTAIGTGARGAMSGIGEVVGAYGAY